MISHRIIKIYLEGPLRHNLVPPQIGTGYASITSPKYPTNLPLQTSNRRDCTISQGNLLQYFIILAIRKLPLSSNLHYLP